MNKLKIILKEISQNRPKKSNQIKTIQNIEHQHYNPFDDLKIGQKKKKKQARF